MVSAVEDRETGGTRNSGFGGVKRDGQQKGGDGGCSEAN